MMNGTVKDVLTLEITLKSILVLQNATFALIIKVQWSEIQESAGLILLVLTGFRRFGMKMKLKLRSLEISIFAKTDSHYFVTYVEKRGKTLISNVIIRIVYFHFM